MKKIIIVSFLLTVGLLSAQEMPLPIDVQYVLFAKIFKFEYTLQKTEDPEITIGIVYQSKFPESLAAKEAWLNTVKNSDLNLIKNKTCRYLEIDLNRDDNLSDIAAAQAISILYVAPLRAVKINDITAVSRQQQFITITGVPQYVEAGLAVGLDLKGERPLIVVNLPAAKAEGADFNSSLLKLAKIIK